MDFRGGSENDLLQQGSIITSTSVTRLKLGHAYLINASTLSQLAIRLPNLKELDLEYCVFWNTADNKSFGHPINIGLPSISLDRLFLLQCIDNKYAGIWSRQYRGFYIKLVTADDNSRSTGGGSSRVIEQEILDITVLLIIWI